MVYNVYILKAIDIPGIDSQYCWKEIITEEGDSQSHQGVNDRGEARPLTLPFQNILTHCVASQRITLSPIPLLPLLNDDNY